MPTADRSDDTVELTSLEVIRRYSLAVRQATADRDELVAALSADLARLQGEAPRPSPAPRKAARRAAAGRG